MTAMTPSKTITYGTVVALILVIMYMLGASYSRTLAGAPTGLPASVATTSLMVVGPLSANTLIATSSCAARIITTYANPIMLTMTDRIGQTPTGSFGILQLASTTVVYDSGQYGCGLVKAYGFTASTSITFTDVR